MHKITEAKKIADTITRLSVEAKRIAKKRKAGQFVIVRESEGGERIPLTIVDSDPEGGTIDIIVQAVGKTTTRISRLRSGDSLQDVAGPLGNPAHIEKYGTAVVIGGGVGVAPMYPIAKALQRKGNEIISILGAQTAASLILRDEMADLSSKVLVTTDDGSAGEKGFVTDALKGLLNEKEDIDFVFAVGPVVMMEAVCELTKKHEIPTMVSLNPIMIDGTGMCGGCRCTVGGEVKFACVDGPEFDGHLVDFKNLRQRLNMFKKHERQIHVGDGGCKLDGKV